MPFTFTGEDYDTLPQPMFGPADGFDANGRDADGYDRNGFNSEGYNRDGYDEYGFDSEGYDRAGYNEDGFNLDGRDRYGYDEYGRDLDGYDRDGYDEDGYDCDGCDSYGDSRGSGWVGYGNPPLRFLQLAEEALVTGPVPFYGMEIELTSYCSDEERIIVEDDPHVWAKEDCSVDGFEMPTHPMTARYAAAKFPWDIVDRLGANGARVIPECNGLHIHVSRDGFQSFNHQERWVRFFYRISEHVQEIGGRDGGRWGRFNTRDRDAIVAHIRERETWENMRREQDLEVNPDEAPWSNTDRYIAINAEPKRTFEVRVMAATTSGAELRARFELVAASVEYTRRAIDHRTWETFEAWLRVNAETYPALAGVVLPSLVLA